MDSRALTTYLLQFLSDNSINCKQSIYKDNNSTVYRTSDLVNIVKIHPGMHPVKLIILLLSILQ